MSDAFDPYYKWLGIKPKDQPPNHYRLLGVELYESDNDVIENAADQRMRHIRSLQVGVNAEISQRILNEIAAARVCLTDPAKRTQYDLQLQTVQAVAPAVASPAAPPVMVAAAPPPMVTAAPPKAAPEPARMAAPHANHYPSQRTGTNRQRSTIKAKSGSPLTLMFIIGGVAGLLLVCGLLILALRQQQQDTSLIPGRSTNEVSPPGHSTSSNPPRTELPKPRLPVPIPPRTTPEKKSPPRATGELHINPLPNLTLQAGQAVRVQASVRDPQRWQGQVRFSEGLGNPPNVKVDPAAGWIEWTPPSNAQRMYVLNVEARAGADEDSVSFQVDLPWARGELKLNSPGYQTAYPDEPLTVHLSARDEVGPAESARFEMVGGPDGANIDQASGVWTWKPREEDLNSSKQVRVQVTDGRGVSATTSFYVSVQKKPPPPENSGEKPGGGGGRRFVLQFNGDAHVATNWRYDGQTPLTIEVLAKPSELRPSAVLGCLHLDGFALSLNADGHWVFVVRDADHNVQVVSDEPASLQRRSHVAGVLADKAIRLFVNGEPQRQVQQVNRFVPSRRALLIGADTNAEGRADAYFHGSISEVRASSRALYSEKFQRPWRLDSQPETLLLLVFNQGEGSEVRDLSGKTHPAVIHGAKWVPR